MKWGSKHLSWTCTKAVTCQHFSLWCCCPQLSSLFISTPSDIPGQTFVQTAWEEGWAQESFLGCYGSANWSCQRFSSLSLCHFYHSKHEVLGMLCEPVCPCKLQSPVSALRAWGVFYRAGLCNSAFPSLFSCFSFLPMPPLRVHHRHTTRTGASSQSPSTLPGRQQVLTPTHSFSPPALPPCQVTSRGWPPTSPLGHQQAHPGERVQPVSFWGWFLPSFGPEICPSEITKRRDLPFQVVHWRRWSVFILVDEEGTAGWGAFGGRMVEWRKAWLKPADLNVK